MAVRFTTSSGTIELDATVSESHTFDLDTTEHPVDRGSEIVDHVRPRPRPLFLEAWIVDHPLKGGGAAGRARTIRSQLIEWAGRGELFEIRTGIETYRNMLLVSVHTPRDASTKAIRMSLSFKEITFAHAQIVEVEALNTSTRKAQGKVSGGKQTGAGATEAEKRKSVLARGVDALLGAFGKGGQ